MFNFNEKIAAQWNKKEEKNAKYVYSSVPVLLISMTNCHNIESWNYIR